MKVYIAGRAKTRSSEVKTIQKKLRSMGHSITYDWAVANDAIKKPYRLPANREQNEAAVPKMLEAAASADVFILLDEPGMRGAYIELGAFLSDVIKKQRKGQVFVVGSGSYEREHIFESPKFVHFLDTIDDVYVALSQ